MRPFKNYQILRGSFERKAKNQGQKNYLFFDRHPLLWSVASFFQIDLVQFESDPTAETQERSETTNFVCTNHKERKEQHAKKKKKQRERSEERKKV